MEHPQSQLNSNIASSAESNQHHIGGMQGLSPPSFKLKHRSPLICFWIQVLSSIETQAEYLFQNVTFEILQTTGVTSIFIVCN